MLRHTWQAAVSRNQHLFCQLSRWKRADGWARFAHPWLDGIGVSIGRRRAARTGECAIKTRETERRRGVGSGSVPVAGALDTEALPMLEMPHDACRRNGRRGWQTAAHAYHRRTCVAGRGCRAMAP